MRLPLIKGSAAYNLRHNERVGAELDGSAMINGQGHGTVSLMRYGLCRMSFNGCEVIAVHNALVWLKKQRPLTEIAHFMERYKMLFGIFGCNPYKLGKALGRYGAAFERYRGNAPDADAFIICYWTGRRLLSSIHTVFCVKQADGGILAFNRHNGCLGAEKCGSADALTGGRKPIAVYTLKKEI